MRRKALFAPIGWEYRMGLPLGAPTGWEHRTGLPLVALRTQSPTSWFNCRQVLLAKRAFSGRVNGGLHLQ